MKNYLFMREDKIVAITGLRKHKLAKDEKSYLIVKENIKKALQEQLELAINNGYNTFYSGMATGSDTIFAEVVLELQQKYDDIRLEAIVPFPEQASTFSLDDKLIYDDLLSKSTMIRFMMPKYQKDIYLRRNDFLVENASLIIAVTDDPTKVRSGTTYTINRARENDVETIIINPFM